MAKEEVLLEEVRKLLEDNEEDDKLSDLRKAYSSATKKKVTELDTLVDHWNSIRPVPETQDLGGMGDFLLDGACPLCGTTKKDDED